MNRHTAPVLVAWLSAGLFACGSDSGGSGGAGSTSSSVGSSPATSASGTGAGGSTSVGSGGGGEDPGVGGSGAGDAGPACTSEISCSVIVETAAKDCDAFLVPLTEEQVAGARCVLESLRDRADVTVAVGFNDGFGYCDRTQTITVRPEALFVREERFEDKGGWIRTRAHEALDAEVYQACLDLPDEELHTCLGFEGELLGDPTDCPDGCSCDEEVQL